MNIEGNTYMFYDKYCGDHGYKNENTNNITLDQLYSGDYMTYNGKNAINEFNKFTDVPNITENIDTNFYQITFFVILKTNNCGEKKFLTVCVNHQKLKDSLDNIPNKDFLIRTCSYHCAYKSKKYNKNTNELIKLKSADANADMTDPIIEEPSFTKIRLFDYQKRTVKWMYDTEIEQRKLNYSYNDEIFFGDIVYDSVQKQFVQFEDRKKIEFDGGLLADEMGVGKTFEVISASLINQPKNISYFNDDTYLTSKATIIFCQNQLAKQWTREFEKTIKEEYNLKVIQLFTKVQHDKLTYIDLLDADFIVVSFNFLGNECYFDQWIKKLSGTKKALTWINSPQYSEEKANDKILEILNDIKNNPKKLFETKPLLNCIKFYRMVTDEFHSIVTDVKYSYILKLLRLFKSDYKWIVTGTPFDKSDLCLENMVDYVTNYKINNVKNILDIESVQNYLLNKFYRKNTNESRKSEYKLKPLKEEIIKLKFTPTERALYNAYIVNSNVDKLSVQVRQACCDPRIIDELKDELAGCKTPEDIQKTLVNHHKKVTDIASKKIRFIKYKIKKAEYKIKITEFRRYRKYLKQIGYKVQIEYPEKIKDPEFDNTDNLQELGEENDENDIFDNESSDDDNDDDKNKPLIIVNDANVANIVQQIHKLLNNNPSVTLNTMKENLHTLNSKLEEATKQYEGKRSTSEFFTNMMDKINKITEKQKNKKDDDDIDEEEMCSICLNPITGEDVGVTKCGHMYCFQCIKEMIQSNPKCPQCMKPTKQNEIYMISFEDLSRKEQTKEIKDKLSLINKVGTKLANLIFYIKNSKEKCIVFSQWDDLLKKVGDTLDTYGIQNVFCRGNVWSRDKAIRDFTTKENIRVIMLSSASAAAGTNLTAATKVILLEPISGTYEFRKNTERQAIGRAHRTGQLAQVSVVRFIIKDTVEEEIFNENIKEDAKFKNDIEVQMLTDDNLNLTKEEIDIIAKNEEENLKKKELKPKKKTKITTKKDDKKLVEYDNEYDSEYDSDYSDDE
jgi:SNF2 family DNA or RNA helicase